RFQPDVLVSQLGVDTHYRDPLANLALTTRGHEALFRKLAELAPRWLALGGGGYALDVVPRSWALAFGVMAGRELPQRLPPTYRSRYGGETLHDDNAPAWTREPEPRVAEQVRAVVAQVKESQGI
ncbi:MAG: acetoin utilization protein AcuC, partial [Chloroflexota bacterium]